jgi:hypothetical protein
MFRLTLARLVKAAAVLALAGAYTAVSGQAPTAPEATGPAVLGSGSFSPIIASLQKTMQFYQLLGIEVPEGSTTAPRPYSTNPRLHSMLGTNGANERHLNARVPGGIGLEPIEFAAIDQRPAKPRIQDPGAVTLVLLVRDVDALLAKAAQAGVPVLTPGGKPVAQANRTRSVLLADPDGRPVELRQVDPLPQTTAPPTSNVIGARLTMTVANTQRTAQLYRDRLKFTFEEGKAFAGDRDLAALSGLEAQVKRSMMVAPGGRMTIELLEFTGANGTPLRTRIQDPGTARMQLTVRDLPAVVEMIKASGSHVVTTGDRAVALPPNLMGVMLPDPDNLYLTLLERCTDCAPRDAPLDYVATGKEPWYGTWKLNPGKSTYVNGFKGNKSATTQVRFWEGGIKYVTDSVNSEGVKGHTEWSAKFDRKEYPVAGVGAVDAYAVQRIDDRTYTVIAMKDGKRTTLSTAQISPDGMTRIVRQTGTQVSGRDVNNTLVYERQQ